MKENNAGLRLCFAMLFIAAVVIGSGIITTYSEDNTKNVLILNSYHKGLSWTDHETEGIYDSLKQAYGNCSIFVEYMDWKNFPTAENLMQLHSYLKYKYSQRKIDIILTTDDAALDFALKNRAELFSDAPVVFCGVNESGIRKLTKGYSRVTGVAEIIDPEKTFKAALEIYPGLKQMFVIFDNTESGLSTGEMTIKAIRKVKPDIKISTVNDESLQDILKDVGKAPDDSVVLITTYYSDAGGQVTGFENFSRVVSQYSRVPVFHLYEFGLNNGAIGGSMLSGRLQGEEAGRMAARVLKGEDISRIPISNKKTTRYIFDYKQLERFGVSMNQVPRGSEVANKPFSFFEAYRNLVITAAIIFMLLVIFIIVLLFYLGKINRMKGELQRNYGELERTQQSLMASEQRYALLFEKMLNGFYAFEPVWNEEGKLVDIRIIDANPGSKHHTGLSTDSVAGKTWSQVYGYPNRSLAAYHRILLSGEPERFETYYPQEDKYYLINAFRISDNQVGVVFDNITEYKQAIREVTLLNEELEQRVNERTEELQEVVNELEAFTYTVSHDLKSPLRAVDGYSRIIAEDFGEKLGDDGGEMLQNIRNICRDMIEMINKLLQYSTTSKAPVVKEEISMEELFRQTFRDMQSANPGRNIVFAMETGLPTVLADKVMVRQVVYNTLSNAVKFTRYREQARISVGCTITGEEYVFYVKDNGEGFDMNYAGKLFGIFQRLHTSDEFEGSGIGLVTVRKIIQKHGGRVWIEGKSGKGATVYFTLPVGL